MSFRSLRESRHLSQERLAQISGLSLRTVQRLEAGHRVSYASLRSLAATFEIDVDSLERELYAVKHSTDEFIEIPRWVRLLQNTGKLAGPPLNRRQTHIAQALTILGGVVFVIGSFLVKSDFVTSVFRTAAMFCFGCGYLQSVASRVFETYKAWPGEGLAADLQSSHPFRVRVLAYSFALLISASFIAMVFWLRS